jgi:hypothetical protein
MGDGARGEYAIDVSDATGQITVHVSAGTSPVVGLGPMTKSQYGATECAITVLTVVNSSLGALWSQRVAARASEFLDVRASSDIPRGSVNVDERLARLSASLDRARIKAASLRTGQGSASHRSAGMRDRVWIEERDGFLVQILVDAGYYATCPIAGLASEVTRCLAELVDASATSRPVSYSDGGNGEMTHD